ncbi:MAG: GspH/FimT family pseudopilin [bacterium]|jgi:prepilin-type N-terminal cleavage/methylation domain-containing protein
MHALRHDPRQAGRHRAAAFTLAEVLVTIAILGLAALCVQPILSGRGDIDAQSATRRLIADLAFAQGDAMNRQEFRRIHFFEDGSGWCVLALGAAELDASFDPETAVLVRDPIAGAGAGGALRVDFGRDGLYAGLRVESAAIDGVSRDLTFDPMGGLVSPSGAASTGGSVVLRSPDRAYRIDFAPFTGKVRVTDLGADAPVVQ